MVPNMCGVDSILGRGNGVFPIQDPSLSIFLSCVVLCFGNDDGWVHTTFIGVFPKSGR